jgi:MinD-like ATPase involved in chromosome partitioning or flagellar assembly
LADQDLDRSEAARKGEARVSRPGQDQPPRVPGQQPPSGTRDGSNPQVPDPQAELPDAFAPGLALSADGDPALDGPGAEPGDAGDPYGPPDDLDTAEAYGPAEEDGTADPYDPSSYGLGALGLVGDDYDTGDGYQTSDHHEEPGQDSPLSLIQNSGRPPGQFGVPAPPGADSWLAEPGGPDAGPAEFRAGPGSSAPLASQPQPLAPQPPQPGRQSAPTPSQPATADSLTTDLLLPGRHKAPVGGWRRAVFRVTGGLVRPPESAAQRRRRELIARVRTPVTGGHHRVAVMSLKGGVGKTTTTVGLGAMLASLRGDRVIAVDANPDRGTLSDKVRLETAATVRDLLNEQYQIQRYTDIRAYTTQAASRLEVLASDRDPTVSVAFSEQDYCDACQVLEHYYSICLTDCGTGLLHSAMTGVLRLADQIVLVSSPSVDGARSASATLDWLQAHGHGDLVRHAVVVLSVIRPRTRSGVDLDRLEQHFAGRCRAVVRVPYDAHLDEGAEVELSRLNRATVDAYLMLAAEVADGFAQPPRPAP